MSRFVDECRKEWRRLGVPEAAAEEMAADLAADLAEAEAEGAAPEQVLGNGVFDARAFAASWARARGVAGPGRHRLLAAGRSPWILVAGAVAALFMTVVGLALVLGGHASMSVGAVRRSVLPLPAPFLSPRPFIQVAPGPLGRAVFLTDRPVHIVGWVLLAVGVAGLGLAVWLWRRWRPWSSRRRHGPDDSVALPSYL